MPIRTGVIYKITNTVLDKSYIGMSMNLKERINNPFFLIPIRQYGR